MKKKGDVVNIPTWALISIIITLFLLVLFMTFFKTVAFKEIFFKDRVARNIALNLNALFSVPGDGYLVEENLYDYSVRIDNEKVEVYEKESELDKATYFYVKSGMQDIEFKFDKPKQLVIAKIKGNVIVSESLQEVANTLK